MAFLVIDKNFEGTLSRDLNDYPEGIVINLDKPLHWTSADAVRKLMFRLQQLFGQKNIKVGHAGTLDPLATGILLICIGRATKQAEWLQSHPKEYLASIEFGATTPSYDLEKEIDATYPFEHIDAAKTAEVLAGFVGVQEQIPPIFSAKLVNGVRAYELARAGEEVAMKSSTIEITETELIDFQEKGGSEQRPAAIVRIACSKGTYIRSFARDLGLSLNSGAHLTGLIRTKSGDFEIKNAISLEDLKLF